MSAYRQYAAEFALLGATMLVGVLGFWDIYFGKGGGAKLHHHLHVVSTYLWMSLLLAQLIYMARGRWAAHRRIGLAVLLAGPLLVASAALLTVHSAHRAVVSGEPDILIVPNVVGTVVLAVQIGLAFMVRKQRKLHGALLTSTLVGFLGPALFFSLLTFAPPFRIEGPETFYRFQTAGWTGQAIIWVAVLAMFLKDRRHNWVYPLAAAGFLVAEALKQVLSRFDLIDPLTRAVGSPSEPATFGVVFLAMAVLLGAILLPMRRSRPAEPAGATPTRQPRLDPDPHQG